MDTSQEQRKRKIGGVDSGGAGPRADVFDQLGNDHLLARVEEQKQLQGSPEEEPSMLALLEGGQADQEQEAERAALEKLGNSDQAKERALGAEGQDIMDEKLEAARSSFGAAPFDGAGLSTVHERIRANLEVKDIVEARQQGRLEELIDEAMRTNALDARDEVIFLLQQVMNDQGELKTILTSSDPASIAIQMIEYLSVMLVDLGDLYSLAAYDHGDILRKIVIDDEAINVQRKLSPLALRMGGFSSVMYQLVVNELAVRPLSAGTGSQGQANEAAAAEDPGMMAPSFRTNLYSLINQFRLFRTSAA
jgi:hypothetical protein